MVLKRKLPRKETRTQPPRNTIDLDAILGTAPAVQPPRRTSSAGIHPPSGSWDLDELVRLEDKHQAWDRLFRPSTIAAIKAAAEAEGIPAETYIELATLRQIAADIE